MKKFFENYGLVALSSIVIIVLIIIAAPVGNAIESATTSMIDSFKNQVVSASSVITGSDTITATYKVNHYLMNLDGTTYTLDATETLSGGVNTSVSPETKEYTGFTAPRAKTVKVNGDGSTVVDYYYSRNLYYLDIDGILDGERKINIYQYGTFDLYVDGKVILKDHYDHCDTYYYGTPYEIKNVKALPGHEFKGVGEGGSLKGTVNENTFDIFLIFDKVQ